MLQDGWRSPPRPERKLLDGRYVRLEPLDPAAHTDHLLASAQEAGADDRFRYLFEETPQDRATLQAWTEKSSQSQDPLFFAVIDKRTGRAAGYAGIHDPLLGQKDSYLLSSAGLGGRIRLFRYLNGAVDVGAPIVSGPEWKSGQIFARFRIWGEF